MRQGLIREAVRQVHVHVGGGKSAASAVYLVATTLDLSESERAELQRRCSA